MNQKREIMNIEDYREYCLSVKGATECMPFDKHTLVFKVMDKMFSFATLYREHLLPSKQLSNVSYPKKVPKKGPHIAQ